MSLDSGGFPPSIRVKTTDFYCEIVNRTEVCL